MERTSILVALAVGFAAFGLTWATVRHFTGLAQEDGAALAIAVGIALVVTIGWAVFESRLFDVWRRHRHH